MAQQLTSKDNEAERVMRLFRSPTLETVRMVEMAIKQHSGKLKKTQLWEKLPRKVMWSTYLIILDYLEEINKIITSSNSIITYIWNPKIAKKYMNMKNVDYK